MATKKTAKKTTKKTAKKKAATKKKATKKKATKKKATKKTAKKKAATKKTAKKKKAAKKAATGKKVVVSQPPAPKRDDGVVEEAVLNWTDLTGARTGAKSYGSNKFYKARIEEVSGGFKVTFNYGRVGQTGQT